MTEEVKTTEVEKIDAESMFPNAPILPILVWPNDTLHEKCEEVTTFGVHLELLANSLLRTMKTRNGIGLAAPQCGVMKNVIAIWIEKDKPMILVNPKIIDSSEQSFEFEEGCLSVPGYFEHRKRPFKIVVEWQTVNGEKHETEFNHLYAFCIQHEIDHLHGKLFIDELSPLKKGLIRKKVKKANR